MQLLTTPLVRISWFRWSCLKRTDGEENFEFVKSRNLQTQIRSDLIFRFHLSCVCCFLWTLRFAFRALFTVPSAHIDPDVCTALSRKGFMQCLCIQSLVSQFY